MGPLQVAGLFQAVLGLILVALGRWGLGAGDSLSAPWRDEEDRLHAAAVHRRGAKACLVFGGLLVAAGLATFVAG